MYVVSKEMQKLLHNGDASLIHPGLFADALKYVESLPWLPSKLCWDGIEHLELNWIQSSDEEVVSWKQSTCLSDHSHIVCVFSHTKPGLIMKSDFAFQHLESVFYGAKRVWFLFGASFEGEHLHIHYHDFCEFDGVQTLRSTRKRK